MQEIAKLTKQLEALELNLRQGAKHHPEMKKVSIADIYDDAHLVCSSLFQTFFIKFAWLQVYVSPYEIK